MVEAVTRLTLEQDPRAVAAAQRGMAATIPGARFATIARAGHLAGLESPDELDATVLQFLGELGQTTP